MTMTQWIIFVSICLKTLHFPQILLFSVRKKIYGAFVECRQNGKNRKTSRSFWTGSVHARWPQYYHVVTPFKLCKFVTFAVYFEDLHLNEISWRQFVDFCCLQLRITTRRRMGPTFFQISCLQLGFKRHEVNVAAGLSRGILTSHSRERTGLTNSIKMDFEFLCASSTIHRARYLALPRLNGMQPLLMY